MRVRVGVCLFAALLCLGVGAMAVPVSATAQVHTSYNYQGTVRIKVGQTVELLPYVAYYDSEAERYLMGAIQWSSLLPEVATVNEKGVATGVKPGTTRITATGMNNLGESIIQTIHLKVENDEVRLPATTHDASFEMYETQMVGLSQLVPADNVTWSVDNERAVTVDKNGAVTAQRVGKAVVSATYQDADGAARTMTIQIKVANEYAYNRWRNDTVTLKKGETLDLLEMFYPSLTGVSSARMGEWLKLSTADSKVASVEGYTVTARSAGSSKVTLEYDDFSNYYRGSEILKIRVVD